MVTKRMVIELESQMEKIDQRQLIIEKKNIELQRMIFELDHDICTLDDMSKEMERRFNYGRSTGSNRNR